jgi:hypothetical protein
MKSHHRWVGTVLVVIALSVSSLANAASVSGQGTWETTLQARDLDGNLATAEAYYDTALNITWLADANAAGTTMTPANANAWAAALDVNGVTGWRLPTVIPINGSTYNVALTTNATSDVGYAPTTTDGTDGGWRDGSGSPVSEMGHMFYVTLGNLGACPPDGGDGNPATCDGSLPPGWGLTNMGPFSNVQSNFYWSGTGLGSSFAWGFLFSHGKQDFNGVDSSLFAWAVHSGDVGASAVPVPAAVWLFGSGLIGLAAVARRRHPLREP